MKYIQMLPALLLLLVTQCSPANNAFSSADLQQLINSKNYTFLAQTAQPLGGRPIQLTTQYTLTVKGDSLISYLPYFGRAFSAPINPTESGLQFVTTNYDYSVASSRKGYSITIKPQQESKANQLIINVTGSGYANLQVLSTNRQAISFRGILQQNK